MSRSLRRPPVAIDSAINCLRISFHCFSSSSNFSRTGPSTSSSSNIPAAAGHPPRSQAFVDQPNQFSTSAVNRGNPSCARIAGTTTFLWATSTICSKSAISISSLDLKWAKRPLLDMPTWPAKIPMVTPAKPEALKRSRPASRMRSRVALPVWLIAGYYSMTDRIFPNFDSGHWNAADGIGESTPDPLASHLSNLIETTGRAITHLDFLEITEINEMPETFVLIHGAWHTGEDFETIANILRDAGHTVYCPTLRGNRPEDDRSKLGLEDAISSVVEFIEESDLTDIRLVGHSYAGMVISGVADRLEKRPRRLVYINAFVPLKGQSLNDMVTPDYAAAFAAIAEANNGAILLPFEIWREKIINEAPIALAPSTP